MPRLMVVVTDLVAKSKELPEIKNPKSFQQSIAKE
jgi:hypothetical protein